jgi:predicted phage terminase large subunit-like protein
LKWDYVYKKAILEDGSLLFPERLSHEFLSQAKRTMGSYLFANQYLNEVIPSDDQTFKRSWLRYGAEVPEHVLTFAFIDPAIGESKHHDYTALIIVSVDVQRNWYVRIAQRQRINPSQIIQMCFDVYDKWKPSVIGIEDVAFQRSIIHFAMEEARRRGVPLPVTGVKRGPDKTKQMRILQLVPRFEWGTLYLPGGLYDLELELAQFPRGAYDDLLDALASIEDIVHYPVPIRRKNEQPHPTDPSYESWYRRKLQQGTREREEEL